MTLGLAAFLERIRSQPENDVLLDRFLLLVADMEDCEEKATLLLEFVSVIRREHPKFALQILRQVYRQIHCPWVRRPQELAMQSLQVLHDTMLSMGREARAGLIANEMQRLRENPLPGEKSPASVRQHEVIREEVSTDIFTSNTIPEEPRINPFVMPQEQDALGAPPGDLPAPSSTPEIDNLTFKDMRKIFRMFDAYMKEEPAAPKAETPDIIPEKVVTPNIVPNIPAAPSITETPLVERIFGSAVHANEVNDPLLPHLLHMSKRLEWKLLPKDAKRIAAQLREARTPLWLVSLWFAIGSEPVRQLFEESASTEELTQTWHACMTFMLDQKMYRRALIFMRMSLDESMHPNTAVSAYQYLATIWRGLRLRGFTWQPEEGSGEFMAKLAMREESLCQGMFVA